MEAETPFQIVDRLVARDVDCVIIGGHAVNYHGYIRATEDIDVVFRRTAASESALFLTLSEFEAFWIGDDVDPATNLERTYPITKDFINQHHVLMLGTSAGYIDLFDFLPGLPGDSMDDFFASAESCLGRKFASLDWLKRLKVASNRPQDRIDLDRLP
jgi:hypothetical protein